LREILGKAAYKKAPQEFRLDGKVESVEQFYHDLMKIGRRK